ncbi:unnamed protein product [Somion occarium]
MQRILSLEKELMQKSTRSRRKSEHGDTRELMNKLVLLKRQRNDLSFIFRLPNELLTSILMTCRSIPDEYDYQLQRYRTFAHNAVLFMSQTCHRWREIALAFPGLWAIIRSTHPGFLRGTLQRAGEVPLSIDLNTHPHDDYVSSKVTNILQRIILQELHRCQQLKLRTAVENYRKICEGVDRVKPILPHLESLGLDLPSGCMGWIPKYSTTDYFLSRSVPRLRRLSTSDMGFEWWSSKYIPPNITHLTIKMVDANEWAHERCSMADIFACLRRLSSLEELELKDALPVLQEFASLAMVAGEETVVLPRLQKLTVESLLPEGAYFANRLVIPSTTSIKTWGNTDDWGKDIPLALPNYARRLAGEHMIGPRVPLRAILFGPDDDYGSYMAFTGFTKVHRSDDMLLLTAPTDFHLTVSGPYGGYFTIMPSVCTQFKEVITDVEFLWISEMGHIPVEQFLSLFSHLEHLRTLASDKATAIFMAQVLTVTSNRADTHDSNDLVFPSLDTLEFGSFTFKGKNKGGIAADLMWQSLVAGLRRRRVCGMGLKYLVFRDCLNVSKADIEALKSEGLIEEGYFRSCGCGCEDEEDIVDYMDDVLGDYEEPFIRGPVVICGSDVSLDSED